MFSHNPDKLIYTGKSKVKRYQCTFIRSGRRDLETVTIDQMDKVQARSQCAKEFGRLDYFNAVDIHEPIKIETDIKDGYGNIVKVGDKI